MMFVTRRSLTDACSTVAKQLDTITSSISVMFISHLKNVFFIILTIETKWVDLQESRTMGAIL